MRRTSWLWLFLLLLCIPAASPALGETASYSFNGEGLRLYLPGEWQVLTLLNLPDKEQEIQALGTTADALEASFLDTGTLLEAFTPEGGQLRLAVKTPPNGVDARDVYAMTPAQRDDFLLRAADSQGLSQGAWVKELPEFATFKGSASLQSLPVHTIAYITVRYGRMFVLSAEIIGREPSSQDEAALFKAASSVLFLGARVTPPPEESQAPRATLSISPTPTPAPAEVRVQRDETYLALDYAPSSSSVSKLTLTGTTEPNTALRYYVNGRGYERFTSDDQGRFTILVRELPKKGKNVVEVQAIGEKGYGIANFTVMLDQAKAPLAVTDTAQGIAGSSAVITGAALPGSQVQILHKAKTYQAQMMADGSFSCEVSLPRMGENSFTIRATLPGYLRNDKSIVVVRVLSQADQQAELMKKLKTVPYDKLLDKPERYKDTPVKYQGTVLSLSGDNGQPLAVIMTENGRNPVALLCDSLMDLELGQEATVLCTLTGTLRKAGLSGETQSIPEARLRFVLFR